MEDKKQEIISRLAALCAQREVCASEARKKIEKWDTDNALADSVIDCLKNERYIDEHRYCRAFIHDKMQYNHWGEYKIAAALRQKSIPDNIVSETLAEIAPQQWQEILDIELKKKARQLKGDSYERRTRLIRFAMQRGFSYTLAEQCAERIEDEDTDTTP